MAGKIKNPRALAATLNGAGRRGITKQNLLDMLASQSKIAGTLSVNNGQSPDQDITIGAGWQRIDVWDLSTVTEGVVDGHRPGRDSGGWYGISDDAGGDYTVTASVRLETNTTGTYSLRVAVADSEGVSSETAYGDSVIVVVGEGGHLAIANGILQDIARDEHLQLELKGPNGAVATIRYAQFGIYR